MTYHLTHLALNWMDVCSLQVATSRLRGVVITARSVYFVSVPSLGISDTVYVSLSTWVRKTPFLLSLAGARVLTNHSALVHRISILQSAIQGQTRRHPLQIMHATPAIPVL